MLCRMHGCFGVNVTCNGMTFDFHQQLYRLKIKFSINFDVLHRSNSFSVKCNKRIHIFLHLLNSVDCHFDVFFLPHLNIGSTNARHEFILIWVLSTFSTISLYLVRGVIASDNKRMHFQLLLLLYFFSSVRCSSSASLQNVWINITLFCIRS